MDGGGVVNNPEKKGNIRWLQVCRVLGRGMSVFVIMLNKPRGSHETMDK